MRKSETDCPKRKEFEKICVLWGKELQRYIFSLTRDDLFATEEIYQNTMVSALTGLACLRDCSRIRPWVFAIAKAEARRYYAAGKADLLDVCAVGDATQESDVMTDFTKHVEERELLKILSGNLTGEELRLYVLHYYYGMALKEISALMHENYSTVRSMHTRGMDKLRKHFVAMR